MALTSGKLARWNIELMQYNFTIIFQNGRSNDLCDMLSRRSYDNDEPHDKNQSYCEQDVLQIFEDNTDQLKQDKQDTCPQPLQCNHSTEKLESVNVIHCQHACNQTQHPDKLDTSVEQKIQA